MTGAAEEREARMERAAERRNRDRGEAPAPRRSTAVRTKPARMTVDMPPALRRKLKGWTGYAANQLDVMDVAGAEVVRILIEMLTARPDDEAWDNEFTPQLARRVLDEVTKRLDER